MSSNIFVKENKPDHHYRIEIPNIVDELPLSPTAFRLYAKYKRLASDNGVCWAKKKTLAEMIDVSPNTFLKAKKELEAPFELLGGLSLIQVQERFKEDGSRDTDLVFIVDIWRANGDYFKNISRGGSNSERGVVQNLNEGGAKFEPKEEPLKKTSLKEEPTYPTLPKKEKSGQVSFSEEEEKICQEKTISFLLNTEFKQLGSSDVDRFTQEEVDDLLTIYGPRKISEAILYVKKIKKRNPSKVKTEKGYILSALYKKWR